MRITYRGDYALKAMLALALHYEQGVLTIHDIAKHIDAPVKFLEQILSDLKKGGYIESRRGKVGGYLLTRPPGQISVGEIIRLLDSPIEPISCVRQKYAGCNEINSCVFKNIWQKVSRATTDIIDNVTFEDLVSEVNSRQKVSAYSI